MSDFRIQISQGRVNVVCSDFLEETDVDELLKFDEYQLEELYMTHAATQARWEQIAINLKTQYDSFVDEFSQKWWAHNKRFGRMVCQAYGDKTMAAASIKELTISIYSKDTTEIEREKYANVAYQIANSKVMGFSDTDLPTFTNLMFKYINSNPPWFFEDVINTEKQLEKNYLTFQNIVKKLESKSFHMKDLKELSMKKHGNIGPMSGTIK